MCKNLKPLKRGIFYEQHTWFCTCQTYIIGNLHISATTQVWMKTWTSSSREGSKPRAQILHTKPNKPSGHPGVESSALPILDDYSRPWDLTPSKEGLILVIEVHWPPKCFVHVFKSHKFHIENQLLSCLNPANLTQIFFFPSGRHSISLLAWVRITYMRKSLWYEAH